VLQLPRRLGPQPRLDGHRFLNLIHGDAILYGAEEAAHQGEGVEAVPFEHLVVRGGVGDDSPPVDPVVLGDGSQVAYHLVFPGDENPAVHLVRQRMGRQPTPDGGVPADLVGLRVVGIDERAEPVGAAPELRAVEWPDRYLHRLISVMLHVLPSRRTQASLTSSACTIRR
jgi:hypothetical protein